MPIIEIKNRFDGSVIYACEALTIKECLENAVKDGADLGGADLRDAYLRNAYLRNADLRDAYLRNADLRDAYLRNADLGGADLRDAYLRNADLRNAYLGGADLGGTDLRGTYLGGTDLRGTDLRGTYLGGAKIKNDIEISLQPIQVTTTVYFVTIYDAHMQIGCKCYSLKEWFGFDDREILEMDGKTALSFWRKWKEPLKSICDAEGRK